MDSDSEQRPPIVKEKVHGGCELAHTPSSPGNDCVSDHASVQVIKYADDATVESLIDNSDESAYRKETDCLVSWCGNSNLELNASKKKMVVDFRKENNPLSSRCKSIVRQ